MSHLKNIIVFQIIFPMIVGCILYALFRDINLIDPENKFFPIINSSYNNWATNCLPDGLWLYSLNATLIVIWKNKSLEILTKWIAISLLISIMMEFLQYYNIINGTFDKYDIITYIASVLLLLFINKNTFTKNKFA